MAVTQQHVIPWIEVAVFYLQSVFGYLFLQFVIPIFWLNALLRNLQIFNCLGLLADLFISSTRAGIGPNSKSAAGKHLVERLDRVRVPSHELQGTADIVVNCQAQ